MTATAASGGGWAGDRRYTVVIPTIGRPSLRALLEALDVAARHGPAPEAVHVVDDRPEGAPLVIPPLSHLTIRVLRSGGRGPATARNVGWRAARSSWVAFLDDDVLVPREWARRLALDLERADRPGVGGSQGRVRVPRPVGRRPTDWERNVIGLESAQWATADLAYRCSALDAVGGFDERFPRAYREDADLGLRVSEAGWLIVRGERTVWHPVRPADRWVSVRAQVGNRDDATMAALHGAGWRARAAAGEGRTGRHATVVASAVGAGLCLALRRPRLAAVAAGGWLLGTGRFAWQRIAPGPRTTHEVVTMLVTSVVIPPVAVFQRLRGWARARRWSGRPLSGAGRPAPVRAVLFDRDGTLIEDVPYNGDPARVRPVSGARAAVDRVRARGIKVAVVSNQSGVARGLLSPDQVERVNRRVEELIGPVDAWYWCPHGADDGCGCRKPAPGLIHQAAKSLGIAPAQCVVIGDIGSDMEAAAAAGARGILVPTPATRREEVDGAEEVATDLVSAVDRALGEPG